MFTVVSVAHRERDGERMTTTEQINEIAKAAAAAQAELKPALKDATNPHFKSKYADLASVVEAASVYASHGIAIFQDVTSGEGGVSVSTRMAHTSGQWIEFGPLTIPLSKMDAHGVGSATTYAKRYGLQAAALIPSEDDDANEAVQNVTKGDAEVRATVKPDAATKKARVMPDEAAADGAVFIEKVIPKTNGKVDWAEVVLSSGESVTAREPGSIALAVNLAQEVTPVVVTTRRNSKGNVELEELARWRVAPAVTAPVVTVAEVI